MSTVDVTAFPSVPSNSSARNESELQRKQIEDWEAAIPDCQENPDVQEPGIVSTLYEASSQKFKKLVATTAQLDANLSSPAVIMEALQVESLRENFLRCILWRAEFGVADGKLDERLSQSIRLREDLILVLLHLCNALYQGQDIRGRCYSR
jgi:hypothetical protein